MTNSLGGALRGVRVLDLTHALAGPFCSQVLGDHGADVIKVEPLEGDFFRRIGPFRDEDNERHYGGLFQSCNRNKRSIALNLKNADGLKTFRALARSADVLVENYRAGVLTKLGIGYEQLREINPRLVYTSVRGFGDRSGGASPYMEWPAFDIVAQAMGGWMGITGEDEMHPVKVGGGPGDTVPGLHAAFGTMAALWHAKATGQGQYVDVAMTDSILAMSELLVSQYAYRGVSQKPVGNNLPGLAPQGTVRAKDGMIAIAAPHDPQWLQLCRLMDRDDLAQDPRFGSETLRWENNAALTAEIETFTTRYTKAQLRDIFGGKVPFSPIYTAREIFEDPHFASRNMLPKVEHPGVQGEVSVPGVPAKLSVTPGAVRHRAPKLGEHTREILREAHFAEAQVERLLADGAIGVSV